LRKLAIISGVRCRTQTGLPRHSTVISWPGGILATSTADAAETGGPYHQKFSAGLFFGSNRVHVRHLVRDRKNGKASPFDPQNTQALPKQAHGAFSA
jgi:hypothetical protein